jgi:hypothetical protein
VQCSIVSEADCVKRKVYRQELKIRFIAQPGDYPFDNIPGVVINNLQKMAHTGILGTIKVIREKNMVRSLTLTLILAATIGIGGCSREKVLPSGTMEDNTYGVITATGTSLRVDPYIFSAKILELNKGTDVTILKRSSEKTWVGRSSDYWYKVKLPQGITGWAYGANIKIVTSGSRSEVLDLARDITENEAEEIRKNITGKWWSVSEKGDFTNHMIEFFPDGTYRSSEKGSSATFEGAYTLDFNKSEILFLSDTSFRDNLDFALRGNRYSLSRNLKGREMKFQKIAETSSGKPVTP